MMIRKMNRLFDAHGRKMFLFITVLIIIAFLGFFTPGFKSLFTPLFQKNYNNVGTVFGEKVTRDILRENIQLNVLGLAINFNRSVDDSAIRDYAEKQAFHIYSMQKAAEKMGICVSADEIATYIRDKDIFKKDGKFNLKTFNTFVDEKLKPNGYDKEELDMAVRQNLMIEKLQDQIKNSVVTTPNEIRQFFNEMFMTNDVEAATYSSKDFLKKVKVTDKDIEFHYQEQVGLNKTDPTRKKPDKKKYYTDPKFKVEMAKFSYDKFAKEAEKLVTDEEIMGYFNTGNDYYIKQENKKQLEKLDKILADVTKYYEKKDAPKSYDDIKDELFVYEKSFPSVETKKKIRNKLLKTKKEELALDKAKQFASDVYMVVENAEKDQVKAFKDAAFDASGSKAISTDWIKGSDKSIANVGYEPDVVQAIKRLNVEMPISDGIKGIQGAYVCFLQKTEPSKQAPLAQVKGEVRKDVKEQKAVNMAREEARNAALKITEALNEGKSFDEIKKTYKFKKINPFSTYRFPYYIPNAREIATLADKTPVGSLSEPENISDGAIFVYVVKKTLPDEKEFEENKKNVTQMYERQKQMVAMQMFESWLSKNAVNYLSAEYQKQNSGN